MSSAGRGSSYRTPVDAARDGGARGGRWWHGEALSAVLKLQNKDFSSWSEGAQERGRLQGLAPKLSPSPGWNDPAPPKTPNATVPESSF